jgi:hypothetical protein
MRDGQNVKSKFFPPLAIILSLKIFDGKVSFMLDGDVQRVSVSAPPPVKKSGQFNRIKNPGYPESSSWQIGDRI